MMILPELAAELCGHSMPFELMPWQNFGGCLSTVLLFPAVYSAYQCSFLPSSGFMNAWSLSLQPVFWCHYQAENCQFNCLTCRGPGCRTSIISCMAVAAMCDLCMSSLPVQAQEFSAPLTSADAKSAAVAKTTVVRDRTLTVFLHSQAYQLA